jgi:hypothetical protein
MNAAYGNEVCILSNVNPLTLAPINHHACPLSILSTCCCLACFPLRRVVLQLSLHADYPQLCPDWPLLLVVVACWPPLVKG